MRNSENFRNCVTEIKDKVVAEIFDLLDKSKTKCADFVNSCSSSPIVIDSPIDDEIYTTDRVYLSGQYRHGEVKIVVKVDYSNSYSNNEDLAINLPVEVLINILEEMEDNEGLFVDYEGYDSEDEDE